MKVYITKHRLATVLVLQIYYYSLLDSPSSPQCLQDGFGSHVISAPGHSRTETIKVTPQQ